jgi:tetratricopeptide (TPR) repeat protein
MRAGPSILFLELVLGAGYAVGQDVTRRTLPGYACVEPVQAAATQVHAGRLREAETTLSSMLAAGGNGLEPSCAGLILNQLAAIMDVSGRAAEAEAFAERAVNTLAAIYPPNDPVLLRPLQILAAARFEQGKTGKARMAFQKMRLIQAQGPEDRALVHGMAAALLQKEGRGKQAEWEYLESLNAWNESGRGDTADAAAVLGFLSLLYIYEQRLDDAGRALDRALAILGTARDAVPLDWIKLLNIRAVLHGRQGDWREAEVDLQRAISAADHEVGLAPVFLSSMWANYSQALRKNHKQREAHSAWARAATFRTQGAQHSVVDVTDLQNGVKIR